MRMSLQIQHTSLLSIIVDSGRPRMMHCGVTPSGPMDWFAFNINNRLLSNPSNSACIEIHQGSFNIVASTPCTIAISGVGVIAKVNDQTIDTWRAFAVERGDTISVATTENGKIGYLGVKGGIDAPVACGSRSTVMREHLGGLDNQGKPLAVGDILKVKPAVAEKHGIDAAQDVLSELLDNVYRPRPIRVSTGNQHQLLGRKAWLTFLNGEYKITAEHSRMGTRLAGPVISNKLVSMRSEGLVEGTIQVPPNGQPIIMNADHQTMGGYPKIANVCRVDLPLLASLPISANITFIECDTARARFLIQHLVRQIDDCFYL